jgi:hypothetical protein
MKDRADDTNNSKIPRGTKSGEPGRVEFDLPMDLDDIVAIAIFDSVLRGKRRRFKSRGGARRPK